MAQVKGVVLSNCNWQFSGQRSCQGDNNACINGWAGSGGNACPDADATYSCCCMQSVNGYDTNNGLCPGGQDTNFCPIIPGIDSINSFVVNPAACYGNSSPCPSACVYNVSQFTTAEDVQAYINGFGTSDPTFSTELMPAFCMQEVATCPMFPGRTTPQTKCARQVSTAADGELCRSWANNINYNTAITAAMGTYCVAQATLTSNPQAECECVTRASDPLYHALKVSQNFNDACWWIPCQNPDFYMVPPAYLQVFDKPDVCPSMICQQVVDVFDATNSQVNFPDSSFFISCPGLGGGSSGSNWLHQHWVVVVVVAIVVVLLIIGGVLGVVYWKPSGGKSGVKK